MSLADGWSPWVAGLGWQSGRAADISAQVDRARAKHALATVSTTPDRRQ